LNPPGDLSVLPDITMDKLAAHILKTSGDK
jgi:hypothetical protein